MPLRKATGNMYDFLTHIWNPVKENLRRILPEHKLYKKGGEK